MAEDEAEPSPRPCTLPGRGRGGAESEARVPRPRTRVLGLSSSDSVDRELVLTSSRTPSSTRSVRHPLPNQGGPLGWLSNTIIRRVGDESVYLTVPSRRRGTEAGGRGTMPRPPMAGGPVLAPPRGGAVVYPVVWQRPAWGVPGGVYPGRGVPGTPRS